MKAKILLTPLGNKIKYRIVGDVYCNRLERILPNSLTLHRKDFRWFRVFSNNRAIERFLHRNKQISMTVELSALGYDTCDSLMGSN